MKLLVKSLAGGNFHLDVSADEKVRVYLTQVLSVKESIQKQQGHAVDLQKLIFSGKILENEKTLEDYGIKEKDFLVVMVSKVCCMHSCSRRLQSRRPRPRSRRRKSPRPRRRKRRKRRRRRRLRPRRPHRAHRVRLPPRRPHRVAVACRPRRSVCVVLTQCPAASSSRRSATFARWDSPARMYSVLCA